MAKRFFRCQTADRPDLAAIGNMSQLPLQGYAFPKIFPLIPVTEKAGTMAVAPAGMATSKGQKDRANSVALNPTHVSIVDVDWTAHRYEGRGALYERDGACYDTEADADEAGAEQSQRDAWNKVEDDAFATVFTAARKSGATELTNGSVVKILQQKAKTVLKYGNPTLVMTTTAFLDFCNIPEIYQRLEKFAGAANDVGYLALAKPEVRKALSTLLAFEDIILFDSDIVDAGGTYDGIVNVMGLRTVEAGSVINMAKKKAMYGWTAVYIPEGAPADKPFDMRSWYDDANKRSVYDSEAYLGVTEAFSGAIAATKLAASYA